MRLKSPAIRCCRFYRDGDVIIVSPTARVRRGDRVVVKTTGGEVMAKILKRQSATELELASFNPSHADARRRRRATSNGWRASSGPASRAMLSLVLDIRGGAGIIAPMIRALMLVVLGAASFAAVYYFATPGEQTTAIESAAALAPSSEAAAEAASAETAPADVAQSMTSSFGLAPSR